MEPNEKIDAGKAFKEAVEFQGKTFLPHRLSIGEKIKVGVLQSIQLKGGEEEVVQPSGEVIIKTKIDEYTKTLAYVTSWLDIALDPKDNADWRGAGNIYDEDYLFGLYNACRAKVEAPFFRGKESGPGGADSTAKQS